MSPATTLPGLARLERKLLPSQTFLPHLCHCRLWPVVGNPRRAVHDGSGQGRVSPTQLCEQMLLCWARCAPQGMGSMSCELSTQGMGDAWINNRHCSRGCVVWHTPLHTWKFSSSLRFHSGWKEFIWFFRISDRIWAKFFMCLLLPFYPSDITLSGDLSVLQVYSSIGKRNWICWVFLLRLLWISGF